MIKKILVVTLLLALVVLGVYVVLLDNQLRGGALQTALQTYIGKKDSDSSVVALAILENYRETRSIAALWSSIYWGFTWTSALFVRMTVAAADFVSRA